MSRRFQFSLKWLFVAMLLVAIAAVPFGYLLRKPGEEVPVAGTVTLDGAPLAFVHVSFFGTDDEKGRTLTNAAGRFAVPLFSGSYHVTVAELDDHFDYIGPRDLYEQILAERAKLPQQVAERYGDRSKSELVTDIRAGKRNDLTFALTTPPNSHRP